MEEKVKTRSEERSSLQDECKGSVPVSAIDAGEAGELLFRETGLRMNPLAHEPCEAEKVDGTAISVSSRGNILVFDFFAVQQACLKPLTKRNITILYSPDQERS